MDVLVEASVNASLPTPIDSARLADCLGGRIEAEQWIAHLQAFFTELTVETIEGFAAAHSVSLVALQRAYEAMKARTGDLSHDVEDWFRYLEDAPATPERNPR